jgi:hypothetical protein
MQLNLANGQRAVPLTVRKVGLMNVARTWSDLPCTIGGFWLDRCGGRVDSALSLVMRGRWRRPVHSNNANR